MNLRLEIDQAVAERLGSLAKQSNYRQYVGEASRQLSGQLGELTNCSEALLFSSASAGLEIALRAAGTGSDDTVLLSGYDYPGNFWAIERTGARPVLLDLAEEGWTICPSSLPTTLEALDTTPKALVVSHLHGQYQPIAQLREICDDHEILLVEDACQTLGGKVGCENSLVPAGSAGHLGIVSFGGGKVLSSGRGGAVVTSDPVMAQKIRLAAGAGSGPYAMSEMTAAVVSAQLPYLDRLNACATQYFSSLAAALNDRWLAPWQFQGDQTGAFYNAGLIYRGIETAGLDEIEQRTLDAGVKLGECFVGFHRRSKRRCDRTSELPNTLQAVERTVVLHHSLAIDASISAADLAALLNRDT